MIFDDKLATLQKNIPSGFPTQALLVTLVHSDKETVKMAKTRLLKNIFKISKPYKVLQ